MDHAFDRKFTHYTTRHDTPLIGGSTILEAATGSGSGVGKGLDERLAMSGSAGTLVSSLVLVGEGTQRNHWV